MVKTLQRVDCEPLCILRSSRSEKVFEPFFFRCKFVVPDFEEALWVKNDSNASHPLSVVLLRKVFFFLAVAPSPFTIEAMPFVRAVHIQWMKLTQTPLT